MYIYTYICIYIYVYIYIHIYIYIYIHIFKRFKAACCFCCCSARLLSVGLGHVVTPGSRPVEPEWHVDMTICPVRQLLYTQGCVVLNTAPQLVEPSVHQADTKICYSHVELKRINLLQGMLHQCCKSPLYKLMACSFFASAVSRRCWWLQTSYWIRGCVGLSHVGVPVALIFIIFHLSLHATVGVVAPGVDLCHILIVVRAVAAPACCHLSLLRVPHTLELGSSPLLSPDAQ